MTSTLDLQRRDRHSRSRYGDEMKTVRE